MSLKYAGEGLDEIDQTSGGMDGIDQKLDGSSRDPACHVSSDVVG
jgi:hypothetical protein